MNSPGLLTPCEVRVWQKINTIAVTADPLTKLSTEITSIKWLSTDPSYLLVTCAGGHFFHNGDQAQIVCANNTLLSTGYTPVTNGTATTFKVKADPTSQRTLAAGIVNVTSSTNQYIIGKVYARAATFYGQNALNTSNSNYVYLGPSNFGTSWACAGVAPGAVESMTIGAGAIVDLGELNLVTALANDGIMVMFH